MFKGILGDFGKPERKPTRGVSVYWSLASPCSFVMFVEDRRYTVFVSLSSAESNHRWSWGSEYDVIDIEEFKFHEDMRITVQEPLGGRRYYQFKKNPDFIAHVRGLLMPVGDFVTTSAAWGHAHKLLDEWKTRTGGRYEVKQDEMGGGIVYSVWLWWSEGGKNWVCSEPEDCTVSHTKTIAELAELAIAKTKPPPVDATQKAWERLTLWARTTGGSHFAISTASENLPKICVRWGYGWDRKYESVTARNAWIPLSQLINEALDKVGAAP